MSEHPIADVFRPWEKILSVGGIAGVIAIMIAGAVAGRYFMHGPENVPDVLSHSLTLILGFYFGTKAGSGHSNENLNQ